MVDALVFSALRWNAEPVVGDAKPWQWRSFDGDFKLGTGYTAAITSRADIARNSPFPISLPLLSVGYPASMLYSVLIHCFNGSPNNGNVAFLFLRHAD
ncbi:MAG: hypothetical protein KGL51_14840 [Betaproteobacteria bacterium]|nr:hypothetical protein [Betaproteobacteria bacterium]MDE2122114.1 hypothetical protein [Betaproteobacteria bacterium]MDE2186916.1 hypothetical protein [Betaproteobacteria bacterium]MDE2325924.1 hypothetical protein [Betaproteobacteria bacterium]